MKNTLLVLAAVAVLGTACKKKKEDDPSPISNKTSAQILGEHPWKLQSSMADKQIDYKGDDQMSDNIYDKMEPCRRDDIFTFTNSNITDKVGAIDAGESKCTGDAQTKDFTWQMLGEKTVKVTGWFYNQQFTIDQFSLNNNKMTVYYTTQDADGLEYKQTDVYVKP